MEAGTTLNLRSNLPERRNDVTPGGVADLALENIAKRAEYFSLGRLAALIGNERQPEAVALSRRIRFNGSWNGL